MQLACPHCDSAIAPADVNVAEDTALCRRCARGLAYSELIHAQDYSDVDPLRPPRGCWHWSDGVETRIGASCRTLAGALLLLFAAGFWNGITWLFTLAGIAAILMHVSPGLVPEHLEPLSEGEPIGLGMAIFLLVFMLPFVAVGFLLLWGLAVTLFGRVEVRIRAGQGEVFHGIGPVGSHKRFNTAEVRRVREETRRRRDSDGDTHTSTRIVIEAERTLDLGLNLRDERRRFMTGMLRRVLLGERS